LVVFDDFLDWNSEQPDRFRQLRDSICGLACSTNRGFFGGPDFRFIFSIMGDDETFAVGVTLKYFEESFSGLLGGNPFNSALLLRVSVVKSSQIIQPLLW
jgi:hypothetical protein